MPALRVHYYYYYRSPRYDRGRAGANYSVARADSVPPIGTESHEAALRPWQYADVLHPASGHALVDDGVRHLWVNATGTAGY